MYRAFRDLGQKRHEVWLQHIYFIGHQRIQKHVAIICKRKYVAFLVLPYALPKLKGKFGSSVSEIIVSYKPSEKSYRILLIYMISDLQVLAHICKNAEIRMRFKKACDLGIYCLYTLKNKNILVVENKFLFFYSFSFILFPDLKSKTGIFTESSQKIDSIVISSSSRSIVSAESKSRFVPFFSACFIR